jgi:acylphosphatase
MKEEIVELKAIFKGKVQGVGFRYTVVEKATHLHLLGTVHNLPNGSVEVKAQGTRDQLKKFIELVLSDAGLARIDSVSEEYNNYKNNYRNFQII